MRLAEAVRFPTVDQLVKAVPSYRIHLPPLQHAAREMGLSLELTDNLPQITYLRGPGENPLWRKPRFPMENAVFG